MNATSVIEHLSGRQAEVEARLVDALRPMVDATVDRWHLYEREESLRQLLQLNDRKDCNYDRPSIGVAYACWYHPQRTVDAIRSLAPMLCSEIGDVDVLDLGSGTGATWWAVLLLEESRLELGGAKRTVRISAVESSPPMNRVALELWTGATRSPAADVVVETSVSSWLDRPPRVESGLAVMSYVFDHGDAEKTHEIGRALSRTLEISGVDRALMLGTQNKNPIVKSALAGLGSAGDWRIESAQKCETPFSGYVKGVGPVRSLLISACNDAQLSARGTASPKWNAPSTVAHIVGRVTLRQARLDVGGRVPLVLDAHQERLTRPVRGRRRRSPQAVLGAAGSGKSRVLVERLVRTVESLRPSHEYSALVTSFNTLMVDQLADWFVDREPDGLAEVCALGEGARRVSGGPWTVTFLNWDKVMTRLFGATPKLFTDDRIAFEKVLAKLSPPEVECSDRYPWSNPEFFAEEYNRVVYGLEVKERTSYESVERRGRGSRLSTEERAVAAKVLWHPFKMKLLCWTDLRIDALERLDAGHSHDVFDEVYFDECQDLLPADFRLLRALVRDDGGLSVWGDPAQGLHVGRSHTLPSLEGRRWTKERLEGSYRLPIRICEAVTPLARAIAAERSSGSPDRYAESDDPEIVLPEAVKSATLGTRPIVITGDGATVAAQLRHVLEVYRPLLDRSGIPGPPVVTVAESNHGLTSMLQASLSEGHVVSESMRAIKGLERPFIVWSTESELPCWSTTAEWVYTILTRTIGVVVVVLAPDTELRIKQVVAMLRRDRLLFWDGFAEAMFDQWCQEVASAAVSS